MGSPSWTMPCSQRVPPPLRASRLELAGGAGWSLQGSGRPKSWLDVDPRTQQCLTSIGHTQTWPYVATTGNPTPSFLMSVTSGKSPGMKGETTHIKNQNPEASSLSNLPTPVSQAAVSVELTGEVASWPFQRVALCAPSRSMEPGLCTSRVPTCLTWVLVEQPPKIPSLLPEQVAAVFLADHQLGPRAHQAAWVHLLEQARREWRQLYAAMAQVTALLLPVGFWPRAFPHPYTL